ncbi:unnamed protein product [Penicillium salamii]|uniref:Uncharacterized protein n=1 Tax=Penicillium salamii TaxID=1612424 RepID=A0A9W4NFV7_9EURO|nr:unnamed protein product [Penicillium salamii]CAG8093271.1 unnamed protein product [Penicillium salamii]CAG8109902.1 unnamed protein product [Penicillium salamii]CAG8114213.1 unnamed protein product [Penicillium salamii]CAG8182522.1 unnamed protein product [Penicillium salamii]
MLDPSQCSVELENVFGPIVASPCLHGFDFTLLFEETILTLLPLGLVSLAAAVRIWKLHNALEKINRSWSYAAKELSWLLYISLHVVLLVLWGRPNAPKTATTLPTEIATIGTSLALLYLSHLEHLRSIRPSTTLNVFLFFTLLFDLTRLRTVYFMSSTRSVTTLLAISWMIKSITLLLEATEKRPLLKKAYENSPIESTSGIINRATFWWLNQILWLGSKSQLTVGSLPALDSDISAASDSTVLAEKWRNANYYSPNSLLWTVISHHKWAFLQGVLPRLLHSGFCFGQPFLVERVLNFMNEPEHVNSTNYARGLVAAYAIVYIGIAVCGLSSIKRHLLTDTQISGAAYQHQTDRIIAMVRGSLVTLIFEKTLRMSTSVVADSGAITLMSTDIERISSCLREIHEVYSVCLIAGVPLAVSCGEAQGVWLEAVEERVAVTSRVLGVMKSVKMTGLTETISNSLRDLRSAEINSSFRFRLYEALGITLSPVFGFGAYILIARANDSATLTNSLAFSALTLFSLLDIPMGSIVNASEDSLAVANCFQRIQKHLLEKERLDYRLSLGNRLPPSETQATVGSLVEIEDSIEEQIKEPCAIMRNVSASWSVDTEFVLKDLNLDIPSFQTTMIVGPVGSGKSSFLRVLLGEIPECSGTISTNFTHAAYCNQSPWINFGTIQENIVGSSSWNQARYNRVIKFCALKPDFQQLPAGDQTKVGVHGSRLSGGQQMRVALARALYSKEHVLILDDALTGLDRETEKIILESVFAPHGTIKESRRTVIMATNSANHLLYADNIIALDASGRVIEQGSYHDLMKAGGYVSTIAGTSKATSTARAPDMTLDPETLQGLNIEEDQQEDSGRRTGDLTVYTFYFQNIGWSLLFIFVACCVMFILGLSFPQIWLQWWTRANEQHPNQHVWYWLSIYAALGVLSLFTAFLGSWVIIMIIQPKASQKFHEILLGTTMSATTSFLTSTDAGTTTNRFSQDLELIDGELPCALELTINAALSCVIEGFLVFFGSSYITAVAIPFCVLAVYYVARFYVQTSRQMRLLDIEKKAPLFSQFLETLGGLSSIRAYGWESDYQLRNRIALDASQRPFYMLYCIQRWITLVLDLLVAAIAVIVISVALSLRGTASMNLLGIALFNIVNFSWTLQSLVKNWIELETSIGAVSRIRSYEQQTATEDLASETHVVAESWPQKGCVEIYNLSASYEVASEPVLKGIDLKVSHGEKIALCGRSGSGKSSLVSAILRILEPSSGSIFIDKTDISKMSRANVRSKINTIPQQPFFLRGSIRLNANPEENATDGLIIESLEAVKLWSHIESKGGLDADWSDDLLSHGQQQLFCLARAMCKSSNLLIMDEATSRYIKKPPPIALMYADIARSVDSETETLMQSVIREQFNGRTIIAIVHKLHTILDFDKIAVMENGRIVEYGSPAVLLSREGSAFKALYETFHHSAEI